MQYGATWDYDAIAPRWLPGAHAQTIWPALLSRAWRGARPHYRRERWPTPDGDFVDVDFQDAPDAAAPLLVLFHGLEGSSQSHYALAFADWARQQGLGLAVPHFRGCSGEINHAPRAYHSGDHAEIGWLLQRAAHARRQRHDTEATGPLLAVGVSLGGNALMRWAGEARAAAHATVAAIAAVCAPLDLTAGGLAIGRGLNRPLYNRMFMRSLRAKALAKWAQHPGLFDRARLLAASDLEAFDDVFTGPVHGFADGRDYWRRASAKPHLRKVAVPALLLNARNDPFVPAASLPTREDVSASVQLWQPHGGGHVGFASGRPPGHVLAMPAAVGTWLLRHAGDAALATTVPTRRAG